MNEMSCSLSIFQLGVGSFLKVGSSRNLGKMHAMRAYCFSFEITDPTDSIHGTGVFTYMSHKYPANVCTYTIHGWYGLENGGSSKNYWNF